MPFNVPLKGRIEPFAATWRDATPADRRAFYDRAGEVGVRVLRAQLKKAVGARGTKMAPRKHPRADHATGPVLSPHYAESRTIRLLDYHAWPNGVTLFWHSGGGQGHRPAWGLVLSYHAAGAVRGAPVRDVRMSDRSVKAVRKEMEAWWATRVRKKAEKSRPPARPASRAPGRRPPAPKPAPLAARPRAAVAGPPPKGPPLKVAVQPRLKPLTRALSSFGAEPTPPLRVAGRGEPQGVFRRAAGKVAGWLGRLFRHGPNAAST